MHELSIVFEVIRTVEDIAKEQGLEKIASITLAVGEGSLIIPQYLEECFPAAIDGKPMFSDTELVIDVIPSEAKGKQCGTIFNVIKTKGFCPNCNSFDKEILTGKEFLIEEILAC